MTPLYWPLKKGETMALAPMTDPSPLRTDAQGVVRVGGTRVTLDQIIEPFRQGVTPEEIAVRYPTLELADVYTLAYYLNHRDWVEAYLADRAGAAEETRREHAETLDVSTLRERLLARRLRARGVVVLPLAADENVDARVLRGLLLRSPEVD